MKLDDARWQGEWIWSAGADHPKPTSRFGGLPATDIGDTKVLFRREFSLNDLAQTARVRVASNSRHILYVNGHEVLRGPIRSSARELFHDLVDISEYLVIGVNCIAVLVRYYGFPTSWWEPTPMTGPGAAGGLVLEAQFDTGHSETVTLLTGPSWRAQIAKAWTPHRPTDEISAQIPEVIDAARFDPAWTMPGFDDSSWEPAVPDATVQFGRPPSTRPPSEPFGTPLGNPLPRPEPRRREPCAVWHVPLAGSAADSPTVLREMLVQLAGTELPDADQKTPLPAEIPSHTGWVLDLGGIVSGILSFRLTADPGVRLAVSLVEVLESFALDSANYIEYTARGDADGYDSLEFMGGRYAIVTTIGAGTLRLDEFAVVEHLRPRPTGPSFSCDDEALNRLHAVALRTVDLCSRDAYLDCPTREQRAWVADSVIHQSVDLTNNTNWSLAIRNVQLLGRARGDGLLPMVAAADFSDPGLVTIPDASLHWTRTVHNLYRYTGDEALIAGLMPTFESVLRWFLPFQGDDGLLRDVTGWVLIEWAPTEVEGAVAALNGLWGRALLDFAEIAEWLGDQSRARWARTVHTRLREGFERFWDAERGIYTDSLQNGARSRRLSEHANAAAVVGGLVPDSRRARLAEVLLDRARVVDPTMLIADYTPSMFFRQTLELRYKPNWDVEHDLVAAQPFFRYVVHDALALLGRADALPALLHDWDRMLAIGPSALREVWRGQSYAHAWSATPARDLVRYVAGISPAEPGFATVRIEPRLGPLRKLEVTAPTPHGPVHVEVEDGLLTMESPRPVYLVGLGGAVDEHPAGRTSVAWPNGDAPEGGTPR
ncbi:hypothetical protein GCM10022239_04870 [Leifsonia bigeumensis]|uniref:Alpha-L-rhamnosidase six-hairpin glycosidase domain-containing protein n=1 Tax=Leifsonella bigeumensis TaxID=433643 RepID=A0ABP7F4K8_9MICO